MAGLTVALIAEEAAGLRTLQLLADRGHRVAAAFTSSPGPLAGRARALGIAVRDAAEVVAPATAGWLRDRDVELLLNVHSLRIVDASLLEAPPLGAYNLHPGPLPERAGLHTPSWAVYEGSGYHGVTLHRMTPLLDAGSIAFADRFEIGPSDNGLSVMTQCVNRGIRLVDQLLDCVERGHPIPAIEQDLSRRRWFAAGPPNDGRLHWTDSARQIVDFVRACDYRPLRSPWGFPRCTAGGDELAILSAQALAEPSGCAPGTVGRDHDGAVRVAAADCWVRVERVQAGERRVAAAEALPEGVRLQ